MLDASYLDAGYEALVTMLQPNALGWLVLGVFIGLCVGILPGLGGAVGLAMLLPFVFGMEPASGIALMMGMAAVVHTSDTFPSVLMGIPGSSGSQATIMDGYPLAKRGEASRALTAAFIGSMVGGLIGSLALFVVVGVARPAILALGSPELFMLALFGLSMVGVLSQGSAITGVVSGLLGLLLGLMGLAPQVAHYRYTFDILYLYDGVPLPVLALGLFAIPEMLDMLVSRQSIARFGNLKGGRIDGARDTWRHKGLVVRSSLLGTGLGVIPGIGGAVVDWIVYGITRQTSRNNEQFGKGDIRGVIGPESANNAKEAGAVIPTVLFGIPGSGNMALLLGGLLLMGVRAGPNMVREDLDVTLSIAWSLALANILGALLCIGLAGIIARISLVPPERLVPFLLVIMTIAAYQTTRNWGDIVAFIVIGFLGWVMKQSGWSRAPMLIGFVLATSTERYLHLSMSLYGFGWLTRPLVVVLAILISLVIFGPIAVSANRMRKTSSARSASENGD